MATLTASKIKDTYKSLLKVGTTANSEITGSLKTIEDGNDNDTALQLSTAGVKSTGTLDVTGVTTLAAVTATTGSFSSTLGVTGLATFVNLTTTGTTTLGDASGDAVTINAATITLANDTNFVLSGGVNGVSFDTNVLSIDATNDRVGIGTTAPTGKLDVKSSTTNEVLFNAVINDGSDKRIASIVNTDGTNYGAFLVLGNAASPITSTITGGTIRFSGANGFDSWINNGGNVGIGTTTITTGILEVKSTSEYTACINTWNSSGTNDNQFLYFYTDSGRTSRGLINFNRSAGLVQYLTTSDYRAKNIIGKFEANNIIDDLKIWNGKMNDATIERPMFIAHEVQEIIPYAVSGIKDAETYQQIDHQIFVPLIVAELQSLRKRVKELENV